MVQIEFWKTSHFYCLSRKGETAWEYSREKGLVKMMPGKVWDKQGTCREHQPGNCCSEQLPALLSGAEGQLASPQFMAALVTLPKELNIWDTNRCFNLGNTCKCPTGGRCAPWPSGTFQLCVPVFFGSLEQQFNIVRTGSDYSLGELLGTWCDQVLPQQTRFLPPPFRPKLWWVRVGACFPQLPGGLNVPEGKWINIICCSRIHCMEMWTRASTCSSWLAGASAKITHFQGKSSLWQVELSSFPFTGGRYKQLAQGVPIDHF